MKKQSDYSLLDRSLHKLAFSSSVLQELLEDIETKVYLKEWEVYKPSKPIFVTSLPRAGTTIILDALCRAPGVASHTYRDMPFLNTPVLWSKLARIIRKKGKYRERAHGDGLSISEDSPEAFEEVVWKKFFPEKYASSAIPIWDTSSDDFTKYFYAHVQKILLLRQSGHESGRYVSKNNANIARTEILHRIFPDAYVLIPLRNPLEHAVSLWKQHKNFLKQHAEDPFIVRYMEDIGHFEFGKIHRPIDFPKCKELIENYHPNSLNYWISYWIAAFDYLGEKRNVLIVSSETLSNSASAGLKLMFDNLELEVPQSLTGDIASMFKPTSKHIKQNEDVDQNLLDTANQIYNTLLTRCILSSINQQNYL